MALAFTIFLRPFDGPLGCFDQVAIEAVRGRKVILPAPFRSRDEIYRFMLPGAAIHRIKMKDLPDALADGRNETFIISSSTDAPTEVPGH